jgi:hypothetical protein
MPTINIDTLVSSLYQCVETRSTEVLWLRSQPLSHYVGITCDFRTFLRGFLDPAVKRLTRQTLPTVNRKHFFMNVLCNESFCPPPPQIKCNVERCSSVEHSSSTVAILKAASEHAHARLLPRLSWSWIVLLRSDTHRKPITSITAILLPFVAYYWHPRKVVRSVQVEDEFLMWFYPFK